MGCPGPSVEQCIHSRCAITQPTGTPHGRRRDNTNEEARAHDTPTCSFSSRTPALIASAAALRDPPCAPPHDDHDLSGRSRGSAAAASAPESKVRARGPAAGSMWRSPVDQERMSMACRSSAPHGSARVRRAARRRPDVSARRSSAPEPLERSRWMKLVASASTRAKRRRGRTAKDRQVRRSAPPLPRARRHDRPGNQSVSAFNAELRREPRDR